MKMTTTTMQQGDSNRELVSALADGELQDDALIQALTAVDQDVDARLAWDAYHLVGDVLRSGEASVGVRDADFVSRLQLKLHQVKPSPSSSSTIDSIATRSISTWPGAKKEPERLAANDPLFRWWRVAGLASVLALVLTGLLGYQGWQESASVTPVMAQATVQAAPTGVASQSVATQEPSVMIRDRQLDALVAAHKQFGGTSALQGPHGFLRNATFEGAGR